MDRLHSTPETVLRYADSSIVNFSASGTYQLVSESEKPLYITCSFGNADDRQHVTQVTLQRKAGDGAWVGTVISSYNQ
jgi:hypothetical protein